jgi:putative adenylate-forming enzyme
MLARFARARWGHRFRDRAALERWQRRRIARLLRRAARVPFYREALAAGGSAGGGPATDRLARLPVVDKATTLAHFDELNARGVRLADALSVGLEAERSRDFSPVVAGDVSVGLSSGTSGTRGVFLVSPIERAQWAGTVLGRVLDPAALARILDRRRPPLRIAFFLRAGGQLYEAVAGSRVDFAWYDLTRPLGEHVDRLKAEAAAGRPPELLVAPPSVLDALTTTAPASFRPLQVVSVAEVLEPDVEQRIAAAWGRPVRQVYQATEGLLALTCAAGALHLNEESVYIQREWIDEEHTRFHPVLTDFDRRTQLVVRYRLDDVLRAAPGRQPAGCPCGRVSRVVAAVEGRDDAVLHLPSVDGRSTVTVFPDAVRQAVLASGASFADWSVRQRGVELRVSLDRPGEGAVSAVIQSLGALLERYGCPAHLEPAPWADRDPAVKHRRIVREAAR